MRIRRELAGCFDELRGKFRVDACRYKESIQRRVDASSAQQDVVCGVPGFCGANSFFEDGADFVTRPISQPVLNAVEYRIRTFRQFTILLKKLLDDPYRIFAKLLPLALPLAACQFGRNLLLRFRQELGSLSLEKKIVLRERAKDGRRSFRRCFCEEQLCELSRFHFAVFPTN